ncbi:hypothetical protein PVAG01_10713 [Phlyctema vagabunda]|uniref:Uncharacterized protein n=1 Tax=Phlyctema vagabunda TaxID=108571 RepID=A0ABR4P322_9HELO
MNPATVVLPRRPHIKSRSGCIECKRRRIKTIPSPTGSNQSYADSTTSTDKIHRESKTNSPSYTTPRSTTPPPEAELPSLNYVELRLMQQFFNTTHKSLTSKPEFQKMWQTELSDFALKHEFAIRSIFALSALEIANTTIDSSESSFYTSHAMLQHQQALRLAHEALEDPSPDNCSALHIFSGLAFIFTMAKPRDGARALSGESPLMVEWFSLMAGIQAIKASFSESLDTGPHGPLLIAARQATSERVAHARREPLLHELETLVRIHVANVEELIVYSRCIDYLHVCFNIIDRPDMECECADVFTWFFAVSPEFIALLKNGAQEALAIFAFACVLFLKIEHFWWAAGWAQYLVAETFEGLDEQHQSWARWPMEQVGLLPPAHMC